MGIFRRQHATVVGSRHLSKGIDDKMDGEPRPLAPLCLSSGLVRMRFSGQKSTHKHLTTSHLPWVCLPFPLPKPPPLLLPPSLSQESQDQDRNITTITFFTLAPFLPYHLVGA